MKMRKSLVVALSVALLGAASIPLSSSAAMDVYFNVAPPAPRVEVVPAPRAGYLWVNGYWDARGKHHAWTRGHWEKERHGYHYSEPRWVQHNDQWALERGRWNRGDSDRDGVPNSRDHSPNNPTRH